MYLLNEPSSNQLSPSQRHIVVTKRNRKSTDRSDRSRHSLHNVFPALPSFKVAIMILSYMAFKANISLLTARLSKRTRIFKMMHKEMLKDYLVSWYPQVLNTLEFGCVDKAFNHKSIPRNLCHDKVIKLKSLTILNRYGLHPYRMKDNHIAKALAFANT